MTAISPDGWPPVAGGSRDKKAHVKPALGGAGSRFCGGGGGFASSMTASAFPGFESASALASPDAQKPNQDVAAGAGAAGGSPGTAGCDGGVGGSFVCVAAGDVSVNGVRDHHPSQLDDGAWRRGVAGSWLVSWFCAWPSFGASLPPPSLVAAPSSGTLAARDADSLLRFGSNRLRSGARVDRTVPPRMFSHATDVEAEALFGARGHDPYQLLTLRICGAVSIRP